MSYLVRRAKTTPDISAPFDAGEWKNTQPLRVMEFCRGGTGYHPEVEFKLLYDSEALYGLFQARDSHVVCAAKHFQDPVCRDSCLEFFTRPSGGVGYVNFEINASGVMLAMYISDSGRTRDGFNQFRYLAADEVKEIEMFHTLPDLVTPEITKETVYRLGWRIPFSFFHRIFGSPVPVKGAVWRANVYKCADRSSNPHWQSWSPITVTNFHLPDQFGTLIFG